jgi:hypothetical protein
MRPFLGFGIPDFAVFGSGFDWLVLGIFSLGLALAAGQSEGEEKSDKEAHSLFVQTDCSEKWRKGV